MSHNSVRRETKKGTRYSGHISNCVTINLKNSSRRRAIKRARERNRAAGASRNFILVTEACQIRKFPKIMKLFSQDDRAFQTCGEPTGQWGGGGDGTRRTEFTRRIRLLWNTPPGVNYFSLGATIVSRCCSLFLSKYIPWLERITGSENIFQSATISRQASSTFLLHFPIKL